jgi:hypothetical protein
MFQDLEKRRIIETIIKTFCAKMKQTKEHLMQGIIIFVYNECLLLSIHYDYSLLQPVCPM